MTGALLTFCTLLGALCLMLLVGFVLVCVATWLRWDVVEPRLQRRRAIEDVIESSRHLARFWATWGHP